MNPAVVAAIIAASASILTLVGTLAAQHYGRRATSRDTEKQLDRTLTEQRAQLDRTLTEQRTRTLNERFGAAAAQLGGDKPAAVRLAGVYAMAGLADDWEENRQTCVDVLCAYLRMPYEAAPGEEASEPERLAFAADREVRHTVIRVITSHLKADTRVSWQGHNLDFTGVSFDGGDFAEAKFSGMVSFRSARFTGFVDFGNAEFSDGRTDFGSASFATGARVEFGSARFSGGIVSFGAAEFHPGSTVFFHGTAFTGATVSFGGAIFSGGVVNFMYADFLTGTVTFAAAEFCGGGVTFANAGFSGGTVLFRAADFTGCNVLFDSADFYGSLIDFTGANLSGGTVSFMDPRSWSRPPRLSGAKKELGILVLPSQDVTSQLPDRRHDSDHNQAT